jgi:hypothetical protein
MPAGVPLRTASPTQLSGTHHPAAGWCSKGLLKTSVTLDLICLLPAAHTTQPLPMGMEDAGQTSAD